MQEVWTVLFLAKAAFIFLITKNRPMPCFICADTVAWRRHKHSLSRYTLTSSIDFLLTACAKGLSTGLFWYINASAILVENCFLLGSESWLQYLRYRFHVLTLQMSIQWIKTFKCHSFVFIGHLYNPINISTRSIPPVAVLYSLIISRHLTSMWFFLFWSHLLTVMFDIGEE